MLLADKVVLVTGVGVGIGRQVATAALEAGARVVVAARTASRVDQAARELDPSGERVFAHPVDLQDAQSCGALVEAAVARFGTIDAFVQNAAFEDAAGGLFQLSLEKWARAFDTNMLGALRLLRGVVPVMRSQGGGSVVLIGSQSSRKPSLPQSGYAASKGALLSASYYLADELGRDNIRVNTVVPGWTWGPVVEGYFDRKAAQQGRPRDEVVGELVGRFPMRRMADEREVADAAVFFCSHLARGITGQSLMVNCGDLMI
jgi:NAD(P)-dependent dehydrogenase (short-subunit alcohol dehydrogenase family)